MSSDTYYVIGEDTLDDIADSIRTKKGYSAETRIATKDFASEIDGISGTLDQLINPDTPNGSVAVISGTSKIANSSFTNEPYKSKIGGVCSFPNSTLIGDYAFQNCVNITSVDAPNVTTMNGNAFNGCTNLINVNIPKVNSGGGYYTFAGCQNLESVNSEVEGFVDLSNFVTG